MLAIGSRGIETLSTPNVSALLWLSVRDISHNTVFCPRSVDTQHVRHTKIVVLGPSHPIGIECCVKKASVYIIQL